MRYKTLPNWERSPQGVFLQRTEKVGNAKWCAETCVLSNSTKFSAGRSLLTACSFLASVASTFITYRLGAMASLKFLATENMPRITVKLLDNESPQFLDGSPQNVHTSSALGQGWKPTFKNFYLPPLKIWRGKKPWNLCQLIEDGPQSEAHNFETHQHVDKRLSYSHLR